MVFSIEFMDERFEFVSGHGGPGHALLLIRSWHYGCALLRPLDRGRRLGLLGAVPKQLPDEPMTITNPAAVVRAERPGIAPQPAQLSMAQR